MFWREISRHVYNHRQAHIHVNFVHKGPLSFSFFEMWLVSLIAHRLTINMQEKLLLWLCSLKRRCVLGFHITISHSNWNQLCNCFGLQSYRSNWKRFNKRWQHCASILYFQGAKIILKLFVTSIRVNFSWYYQLRVPISSRSMQVIYSNPSFFTSFNK